MSDMAFLLLLHHATLLYHGETLHPPEYHMTAAVFTQ
jgi:hypothetical protein